MNLNPVTTRQKQVLDFIANHIEKTGCSPTYQVIADSLGLKSLASVAKHVKSLIERGRLRKAYRETQTLQVVEETERFVFEGPHHLWDRILMCYWVKESDCKK